MQGIEETQETISRTTSQGSDSTSSGKASQPSRVSQYSTEDVSDLTNCGSFDGEASANIEGRPRSPATVQRPGPDGVARPDTSEAGLQNSCCDLFVLSRLRRAIPDLDYKPSKQLLQLWPGLSLDYQYTAQGGAKRYEHNLIQEMTEVGDCLCAAGSYSDAFDIYYIVFAYLFDTGLPCHPSMHIHETVLDCARTSATNERNESATAMIHFVLRLYESEGLRDSVATYVLRSYLRDIQSSKSSNTQDIAQSIIVDNTIETKFDSTELALHLPQRHRYHTILTMEKRAYQLNTYSLQAPRYTFPLSQMTVLQLNSDVRLKAIPRQLLKWCAKVIQDNAHSISAFGWTLKGHPEQVKQCMSRLLFCHLGEIWLRETYGAKARTRTPSNLRKILAEAHISEGEALSAISVMVVDERYLKSPHS